jgi:hypothetical protein
VVGVTLRPAMVREVGALATSFARFACSSRGHSGSVVIVCEASVPSTNRQLTCSSFFVLDDNPMWHHKEGTFPLAPGKEWISRPYTF